MKNNNGWLTLFVVAVASATLSRTFIFRLVNGEFYLGILFVLVLFLPRLLEWIWHLPLRPIDLTISCDPLKPSPSLLCQHLREALRRIYSEGGDYLIYISPMPNTGMRIAFNLSKQRIEAKCGSCIYPSEESNYQIPPFRFNDSPVVYRLSGENDELVDGVYLRVRAKRGDCLHFSKLTVNKYALVIAECIALLIGWCFSIIPILLGAIILRRLNVESLRGILRYILIFIAIILAAMQLFSFSW